MKLTKKGEYGLRALLSLTLAYGQQPLNLREISRREKIPYKFLEQIMTLLKRGRFVQSVKGQFGGYSLSRPAEEITLGEVIRTLEGPLAPLGSAAEIRKIIDAETHHPGLYSVVMDVHNAISEILDQRTLADVCERSLELTQTQTAYHMYHI